MQHTERLQASACPPNYRFAGYEYDSETGLSYAFARYYSPRLGRFLSADPMGGSIGSLQTHNAHAYVNNNPLNAVDPSGLCTQIHGHDIGNCYAWLYDLFGWGSDPNGPSCSVDGFSMSCNTALGLLQEGIANLCADPSCSKLVGVGAVNIAPGITAIINGYCVNWAMGSESSQTCHINEVSVLGITRGSRKGYGFRCVG